MSERKELETAIYNAKAEILEWQTVLAEKEEKLMELRQAFFLAEAKAHRDAAHRKLLEVLGEDGFRDWFIVTANRIYEKLDS